MKRSVIIVLSTFFFSMLTTVTATVHQRVPLSDYHFQNQYLQCAESMANVYQHHPIRDVLRARRLFINDVFIDGFFQGETPVLRSDKPVSNHGLLSFPMSLELISVLPDPRLYSIFTAADLGGYEDNLPPYEPSDPYPQDNAINVPRDVTLQWEGGDPNPEDMVYYDLYFGTASSPSLYMSSLTTTQYALTNLTPDTMYYWKIVARDNWDAETAGPLWNFVTASSTAPTPTPNSCTEFSVQLDMGSDYFCPGDTVFLTATICNPEQTQYLPLWVILEIEGMYWFAPTWTESVNYYLSTPIPAGWSAREIIPSFIWPTVEGQYLGAVFYGALTTPDFQLLGTYSTYTFGWGPCM